MNNERSNLGFEVIEEGEGSFADVLENPKALLGTSAKKPKPQAPRNEVIAAAEAVGFHSRERRRRTGRNAQLNLKVSPETREQFYAIADDNALGLGEAFEEALELLAEKYATK